MHARRLLAAVDREAALLLAERTFGHLDLGGATVRDELTEVCWPRSVGLFDGAACAAMILVAERALPEHVPDAVARDAGFDPEPLRGLPSLRGDALVVPPAARTAALPMFRLLLADAQGCDYLWGTAHPDLNNTGFWGRHATVLGLLDAKQEWVFALPLTRRGEAALAQARTVAPEPQRGPR